MLGSNSPVFTDWHKCYSLNWNGLIVPAAMSHPAKYARGLIQRIIRHGLQQGYWHVGSCLADPFGGVALGGIICGYKGINWLGCEIEPRFAELGQQNIALHQPKWQALGLNVDVRILLGDSRRFHEIVGEAQGCVFPPPFASMLSHGQKETDRKEYFNKVAGASGTDYVDYGTTPGQIGALKTGDIDGAVLSPPFVDTGTNDSREYGGLAEKRQQGGVIGKIYGNEPAQIGNLKAGSVDSVVSSPPYAANEKHDYRVLDENGKDRDERRGMQQGKGGFRGSETYGDAEGQIGRLPTGSVEGICTSPPYADGLGHSRGEAGEQREVGDNRGHDGGVVPSTGYGAEAGQIANLPTGSVDGSVTSPLYADSLYGDDKRDYEQAKLEEAKASGATATRATWGVNKGSSDTLSGRGYGNEPEQIGSTTGENYWQACSLVYQSMMLALRPGGTVAMVVKDYVSKGKRVPLCDDTCRLLASLGFDVFERTRCWVVEHDDHPGLFGENVRKTKSRKSFFRRLAEAKGSPAIDFEEILWARKPE